MLDSNLLRAFCSGFFGYGVANADYWFISMEEGGGNSEAEITARLEAWDKRGRRDLEEIDEYHRAIGQGNWFSEHPPIQRTWAAAIRIVLAIERRNTSTEDVRAYQRDYLARRGGSTRLSPLFPLPSRSLDHWNYASWSDDSALADRATYKSTLETSRLELLAHSVQRLKPKVVAFFGVSYTSYWTQVAKAKFSAAEQGIQIGTNGVTKFAICSHPAAKGVPNAYFLTVASVLKAC